MYNYNSSFIYLQIEYIVVLNHTIASLVVHMEYIPDILDGTWCVCVCVCVQEGGSQRYWNVQLPKHTFEQSVEDIQ